MILQRSNDRKTANLVAISGKTGNTRPAIKNAFGLPPGRVGACPGATNFCETVCYGGEVKLQPGVINVLTRNFDALEKASRAEMVTLLSEMIEDFVRDCDKRGADKLFRIHWDGDFFSPIYVAAWHAVIKANPDVRFWAYTRVPTAAVYLHAQKLSNLALYFSGDPDNVDVARHLAAKGIRIAYLDRNFTAGKAMFDDAVRCPENNGALPLISPAGSACVRCGLCIRGTRNVLFSSTKKRVGR